MALSLNNAIGNRVIGHRLNGKLIIISNNNYLKTIIMHLQLDEIRNTTLVPTKITPAIAGMIFAQPTPALRCPRFDTILKDVYIWTGLDPIR